MNLIKEIDELSGDFRAPRGPQGVMEALVTRLTSRYAAAAAGVWRLDAGQSRFSLAAFSGGPALPSSLREVSASHSALGRAGQAKLPQTYTGSAAEGDELALWAEQNQFRFLTTYPLADDSSTGGVLLVAAPQVPDEPLLALLRLQARLAYAAWRDAEMVAGLQHNLDRLQALVEASKVFNSTLDLSEVLGKILDVAKNLTKAERGTLFWLMKKPMRSGR